MTPFNRWLKILFLSLLLLTTSVSQAQDGAPTLTMTGEQEIGVQCPVDAARQPENLWVLMDDCGGYEFALQVFDSTTGDLLDAPISIDRIDGVVYDIDRFINPLAFTSENTLELIATNFEDETFTRFQIDLDTFAVTEDTSDGLNELLRQYSEYPVYTTTFSDDHRLAAVRDDVAAVYVLDLDSETVLFEVDAAVGISAFSADSQRLYVSALDNPDDYTSFEGTLSVYSVPDGELLHSLPLPFSELYPDDEGRMLAVVVASSEVGEEQLGVLDLETNALSPLLPISEAPQRVLACRNDGSDRSDVDLNTTGRLSIIVLQWLTDGSGFFTMNSPGWQSDNTGCVYDVSRLRHYTVSGG